MVYSRSEIAQFIEEEDVKFIRLAFVDVFGRQKNLSIMRDELESAFDQGVSFDASRASGFENVDSDLVLRPEVETIAVLPWRPDRGRVVRMFCSLERPDGSPYECDTRAVLKRALADAHALDVSFRFGAEMEFYLFQRDEHGVATKRPFDLAGYMDVTPLDKGENFRRQVCLTLEQMGIKPKSSHHEAGPGQNEIDFQSFDPLSAADAAVTFRFVVNTIASANGLFADYSPRPLADQPGNGLRLTVAARANGREDVASQVLAGLLEHVYESTLFYNPVAESYSRFGHDADLSYITWSKDSRASLARVPSRLGVRERVELRSPDSTCNPYLAYALAIWSSLDGIARNLSAPVESFYSHGAVTSSPSHKLPQNIEEARAAASRSEFIANRIPEPILRSYLASSAR